MQHFWRSFPDVSIPALDGRTPRQAAAEPAFRTRLIELMKRHIRTLDENNLREDRRDDINPLLRELGLHEIDVPPPPPRKPPPEAAGFGRGDWGRPDEDRDNDGDDSEDWDETNTADLPRRLIRPGGPRGFVNRELTLDEAGARIDAAVTQFDTAAEAMDEMKASGSTLIEDLFEMTSEILDESGSTLLTSFVVMAWFSLVPRGTRAPSVSRRSIEAAFAKKCDAVEDQIGESPEAALELFAEGPQPNLTLLIIGQYYSSLEKLPKKHRPSPESRAYFPIILSVVISEIDHAIRG